MRCAVGDCGEMDEAVGRAADRLHHDLRVPERGRRQEFARLWSLAFAITPPPCQLASAERNRSACGAGMVALSSRQRDASVTQAMVERALYAGADRWRKPAVDGFDLHVVDLAGRYCPQPSAISCRRPAPRPCDGRPPSVPPEQRSQSALTAAMICAGVFVAAADHDHGIHRLGTNHLLGIHRHQIAQIHPEVGWAKLSAIEMVGNTIGIAPDSITPRFTASRICGTLP